jgi:hypothetical protein
MESDYSPVRFLGVVTTVSNAAMLTVDLNGGADYKTSSNSGSFSEKPDTS